MSFTVSVNEGKYTVVFHENGKLEALRYDEPWRDLVGDNLVYWLAVELQNAREELAKIREQDIDFDYDGELYPWGESV